MGPYERFILDSVDAVHAERRDSGQATPEYALVMLAAAAIALAVVKVGPDAVAGLFQGVVDHIGGMVE